MPKANLYRSTCELEDGRELTLEFYLTYWPATRWAPEEIETAGHCYWIDNQPVNEKDLPAEVTDDLIEGLENSASIAHQDH